MSLSSMSSKKGIVALIDLPVGSAISMNGKSIQLKRDDFVGFTSLRPCAFHLVTAQAFPDSSKGIGSSRHGIVLRMECGKDDSWIVAHRYNPQTEETEPITTETTIQNLDTCIRKNQMGPPRIICLDQLISENERGEWERSTEFISTVLLKKRNLDHGCKVLPGAFHDDSKESSYKSSEKIIDGNDIKYPPIPIPSNDDNSRCKHGGTRRYLSGLKPSERTAFLLNLDGSSFDVLDRIMDEYYNNKWSEILGDLQLAYIMFLHLQCLSSLEHWRDIIAMLSLVEKKKIESKPELYHGLVNVLNLQLKYIDHDFFEDLELSEGNFFLPAIQRLITKMKACNSEGFVRKAKELEQAVTALSSWFNRHSNDEQELLKEMNDNNASISHDQNEDRMIDDNDDDEDDDDGPVVVSIEEYEASLARSQNNKADRDCNNKYPLEQKNRYALLFASMQPHEDIMMTCARVLDTQVDVSLVREAAQYLEHEVSEQ